MADKDENPVLKVTVTDDETGEESVIEIGKAQIDEVIDELYNDPNPPTHLTECVVIGEGGGGFVELSLSLDPIIGWMKDPLDLDVLPLYSVDPSIMLKQGGYLAIYLSSLDDDLSEEGRGHFERAGRQGILITPDESQVFGKGYTLAPVESSEIDDDSSREFVGWAIQSDKTGEYVTVVNLIACVQGHAIACLALQRLEEKGALTVTRGKNKELPSITSAHIKETDFTTEKLSRGMWGQFANQNPGQWALAFDEEGRGTLGVNTANAIDSKDGRAVTITYSIDFDALEEEGIIPELKAFDHRVYEAVSSLWSHTGQEVFSLQDIHAAMGNVGKMSPAQRERLNNSLTKMSKAHIVIDNQEEASAYNYEHFAYDAMLLPMERLTRGYVDGQITSGLIHVFREPPVTTFARGKRQITTHSLKLLQTPLSKTDTNIAIEDYLREQISWMKNPQGRKRGNRILTSSIFEAAGITRRDQKSRKLKDIRKVLDHYKACGWIDGYKENKEGFTIEL